MDDPDHPTATFRTHRLLRLLGLDRNPLRRRTDHAESILLLAAMVVALLLVPVACAIGTSVHATAVQRSAQQRDSLHVVTATVIGDRLAAPSGVLARPITSAAWVDDAGRTHTGLLPAGADIDADGRARVWIDDDGRAHPAPASPTDDVLVAVTTAFLALILGWILVAAVVGAVRTGMEHRRLADWEREWRIVGASWTGRTP